MTASATSVHSAAILRIGLGLTALLLVHAAWPAAAEPAGTQTVVMPAPSQTRSSPQAWPVPSRDGLDRQVRIHNQTGWTMRGLQAAGTGSGDWQADILPPDALPTGASALVDVDDGRGACLFDLRAHFSNGQTLDRSRINVCQVADFYYTR